MPVLFILMLPVAFAASVKNEDHVDNSFAFAYDSATESITAATSSKIYDFDDDVDFSVGVKETTGERPLVANVRFRLLSKEAVKYNGTLKLKIVNSSGDTAYSKNRRVSFTLRPKGERLRRLDFPFDVETGEYKVGVTFSR